MKTRFSVPGLGCIAFVALTAPGAVFAQQPPTGAMPPPTPPIVLKGQMGKWIDFNGALYRVVSHESGMRDYHLKYNQSGRVIHPGYSKDRMAVVEIEIKNVTDHPILPPIFSAALTDSEGARTTDWTLDARQASFLADSGRGRRFGDASPAEIGPGATMKIGAVFSVSPKARPTMLEFSPQNFRDMGFGRRPPATNTYAGRPGANGPGGQRPNPLREQQRVIRFQIDLTSSAKP